MSVKEILLREKAGLTRKGEPVRVSVPFAKGELRAPDEVGLLGPDGEACPVQYAPLSRWHDGSVQWLLCEFQGEAPAAGESAYRLAPGVRPPPLQPVRVTPGEGSWQVDTGTALFTVDATVLRPFLRVAVSGTERISGGETLCPLALPDGSLLPGVVDAITLESSGPLRATLVLKGRFGAAALFSSRLTFFAKKSLCLMELTLHNPRAARHEGGRWDLGDPGSLFFRELALSLGFAEGAVAEVSLTCEGQAFRPSDAALSLSIRQESSGGGQRLSPNHRAAGGNLASTATGYRIDAGAATLAQGDRTLPTLRCSQGASGVAAFIPRFWQEFPKALEGGGRALKVSFFPAGLPEPHELQGGERKTSQVWLDFDAEADALQWLRAPLCALAAPEAVLSARVLPDLPPGCAGKDLVDRFLPNPEQLLSRREIIDEYGWRHFGDIYADHEAVYHQGEEPFVSHYNNQYDICAGLYRKFLATGDPAWGELAADLARHLVDIDIYHTEEDREEYNGGLFWHTDHYISAGLATHRTFSAVHLGVKDPRFFGGGPGAEHCYTSGLLLHYYLTGDPDFREAVVSLAEWCYRSLTGPHTVLAVAKKGARYLSLLRHAKGSVFPDHPLTRGTGNTINASLDAFQATGDRKYLVRVEELIRGALHPDDDIAARNILNPEAGWSYTVLLAAVAKFLDKKRELAEFDPGYCYARGALLAYARWMVSHEYPYLAKPELLEYPNETWAAQELRKCVVLYHAARYGSSERTALLDKARFLLEAALTDLSRFPTSNCTRPLALMLQNGWIEAVLAAGDQGWQYPAPSPSPGTPTPYLNLGAVGRRVGRELRRALRVTTLKSELAWLRARLN